MGYWVRQSAAVALLSLVLLAALGAYHLFVPTGEGPEQLIFSIAPGEPASSVAVRLDSLGLLRRPEVWLAYARLTGAETELRAGPYYLGRSSPAHILSLFREGRILEYRVTVPEGSTLSDVAEMLERTVGTSKHAFFLAVTDTALLATLGSPGPTAEGYLFPDTYLLPWQADARDVTGLMISRFLAVWSDLAEGRTLPSGLGRHAVVTMASLVEAEAALDAERPRIAAVYYNRLRRGMKLEADPTVAYAMGSSPRRLLYRHLAVESPYNTYLHPGLPPTPICSPGAASLLAALEPLEGCSDLYFVAVGDGTHLFSRTHEEHLLAKAATRASRSSSDDTTDAEAE